MATRLYGVATTAAPITPTPDAGWQSTTGFVRRSLALTKAAGTESRSSVAVTSGANNETLGFQLVSPPLAAQTISGTVTIVMRCRELAAQDNIDRRARGIRVVSNDGSTVRGTLLAQGFHAGATTELGIALAGYIAASATAVSSVVAQAGDRIVVEIGLGMSATGTTPLYDMEIGGSGTDYTLADGTLTGTVPWVEFSADLTWQGQTVTTGQPSETDTALTAARRKVRTLGQAVETDTPLGVTRRKTRTTGQPAETDSALAATRGSNADIVVVGQAVETDSALALARVKARTAGQPAETDSGLAVTPRKVRTAGQPAEADSALGVTRRHTKTLGQPAETDSGLTVVRRKVRTLGIAVETDSGLTVVRARSRLLGQAVETDSGLTVARRHIKTLGEPTETDSGLAATRRRSRLLGQPAETDSALPVVLDLRVVVGQPTETDTALGATRRKVRTLGIAVETDTGLTPARRRTRVLGLVVETDTGLTIARRKARTVGQPTEADLTWPVVRLRVRVLGLPSEVDVALAATQPEPQGPPARPARAPTVFLLLSAAEVLDLPAARVVASRPVAEWVGLPTAVLSDPLAEMEEV